MIANQQKYSASACASGEGLSPAAYLLDMDTEMRCTLCMSPCSP